MQEIEIVERETLENKAYRLRIDLIEKPRRCKSQAYNTTRYHPESYLIRTLLQHIFPLTEQSPV